MNEHSFPVPSLEAMMDKFGPIVCETVIVQGRTFLIEHPGESDRLQKHPAVRAANAKDEYMPFWADLWPASRMLAKAILQEPAFQSAEKPDALEIGCGLGLPGVVALSIGLRVTFSDYDACALLFAGENARLNGYEHFRTTQLDWRSPPDDLRVPVILASDLVYQERNLTPVVAFLKRALLPGGLCLLTDEDRIPANVIKECLHRENLPFTTKMMRAGEPGGLRHKGTLYRITAPP